MPFEIKTELDKYENYIASTYYFYTLSKKDLEKINYGCENNKIKEIYDNYINLSRTSKETSNYLDKTTKQSILLLKVYSQYLLDQDIILLPEEDIFEDYVLLNLNLNNLKSLKEEDTYIYRLNKEIEKLNYQAQQLGFEKGYIAPTNVPDLLSYYSKIYTPDMDNTIINVPLIEESSIYVFDNLSQIEDVSKINVNLKNIDAYNYYIVINKFVGKNNSIITDFRNITNRVNNNLDAINNKIKNYEKEIENDYNYLENKSNYESLKKNYKNNEITFGYYLSELKKISVEINKNKINVDKADIEKENNLLECDIVIIKAKEFSNLYIKEKIKEYEKSNNFLEKKDICLLIKNILSEKECVEKINKFLLSEEDIKNEFELLKIEEGKECIEILGNINYKLQGSEKIIVIKKYLQEIKLKIIEIKRETNNTDILTELEKINIDYKNIDKKNNLELIIDYANTISKINEINYHLDKITKIIISNEKYRKINSIYENTFLVITNPFSFTLENIELKNNFGVINSKNNFLIITNNTLKINNLYPGENLFEITFENKKEIDLEIIFLSIEKSIIKIKIKNQIENLFDYIEIPDGFITYDLTTEIKGNKLFYKTKKENEIIIYGPAFEIDKKIYFQDIIAEKGIVVENITLKNKLFKDINNKIEFLDIKMEDYIIITENEKEKKYDIENNKVIFDINIKKQETKKYKLEIIRNIQEIYAEINEKIIKINKIKNTKFIDVKKEADLNIKTLYDIPYKKTYSVMEIKSIYEKEEELNKIQNLLELSEAAEIRYFLKENKLLEKNLTTQEKEKYNRINNNKYNNIRIAEKEINDLFEQIMLREENDTKKIFFENQKELSDIKNKIEKYRLDVNADDILFYKNTNEIKLLLLDKLREKANEIYLAINPAINGLDTKKINVLINKVYLLYQDKSLPDMYNVKYFAGITENDAKRLEKNYEFIDSVLFNKEITKFEENYENKEYEKAIDSISIETINRINKIKKDVELIEKGIEIIKQDAKTEILEYQKKEYDQEILTLAKTEYENEKYLNVIYLIKSQDTPIKKTIKSKQIIISITIIVVFLLIYAYLKLGKHNKDESTKDKKKKVIRR